MRSNFQFAAILFLIVNVSTYAQVFNPFYDDLVQTVSYSNIQSDLITFTGFGVKEPGTTAISNAQDWIVTRYLDLGYTDIEEQPFNVGGQTTSNIIITKTGSVYPNTFLIIDGHYDTVNGVGANDNGSGTALLLELARILQNVDTEYSIKFIHFSGEEAGLIGSEYYVNTVVIPQNLDIKLVFNIDQVGGVNGLNNDTIICERDESNSPSSNNAASAQATTELANCIGLYSDLLTEISFAYGSDYVPFEDNGEIITGLYEEKESPYTHSPNDVISNMDISYLHQVVKGSMGAALHFAVGVGLLNSEEHLLSANIEMFPNPTDDIIHVNFKSDLTEASVLTIIDAQGKLIKSVSLTTQSNTISLGHLSKGIYLATLMYQNQKVTKKIVIE
ncbi:M28 family peptidase [Ulvibacter antarcticus]|uniref:Putative secreted protein (Por secretion system target) n=1 Tax=Ulvibacter antarcticus TaxID=442714 RepID=A0A3L9YHF6_9FLAO|nr:M28 family peptidase [Ulvibacter antarcticus]RMA58629.1 putative secreted protein (Por secretion system target) [Ulvibacter antarcticus]